MCFLGQHKMSYPKVSQKWILISPFVKNFIKTGSKGDQGYLPFTLENRKFWMENQMVGNIPFGKLQEIWGVL